MLLWSVLMHWLEPEMLFPVFVVACSMLYHFVLQFSELLAPCFWSLPRLCSFPCCLVFLCLICIHVFMYVCVLLWHLHLFEPVCCDHFACLVEFMFSLLLNVAACIGSFLPLCTESLFMLLPVLVLYLSLVILPCCLAVLMLIVPAFVPLSSFDLSPCFESCLSTLSSCCLTCYTYVYIYICIHTYIYVYVCRLLCFSCYVMFSCIHVVFSWVYKLPGPCHCVFAACVTTLPSFLLSCSFDHMLSLWPCITALSICFGLVLHGLGPMFAPCSCHLCLSLWLACFTTLQSRSCSCMLWFDGPETHQHVYIHILVYMYIHI